MPAKGDIVLVIGGGGREHAVIKALAQSPEIKEIHAAPGNGGIASLAHCHDLAATDIEGLLELAKELKCDFVVVTPDDPGRYLGGRRDKGLWPQQGCRQNRIE